jgi:homoserine kinase
MLMPREVVAFAPASVGNAAVGFDVLGHAISGAGDRVRARRIESPEVRIAAITGLVTNLPFDPERNTAARAVAAWRAATGVDFGVELEIEKGIALGSGMGGSAASAVAALVAANALRDQPEALEALYPHALIGEAAASGGSHGDNVGPQLIGGLVLATHDRLVPIPVPTGLTAALVHPPLVLETRRARAALSEPYPIAEIVRQTERLALVLAGCFKGDLELIAAGLEDVLVEPRRAGLIPGFAAVKAAALANGALGASISGAGPSVFAWCRDAEAAGRIADAMRGAFADALGCDRDAIARHVAPVASPGAFVEQIT